MALRVHANLANVGRQRRVDFPQQRQVLTTRRAAAQVCVKFVPEAERLAAAGDRAPAELPSLFVALEEQLGLKLEPGRAPVDVAVIDSIQRPVED
jgi:uncharacterized protein (TIGR03435 family)